MNPLLRKENIEVVNTITQNYQINVDQRQFEQVLINLVTNAINALEKTDQKRFLFRLKPKKTEFL